MVHTVAARGTVAQRVLRAGKSEGSDSPPSVHALVPVNLRGQRAPFTDPMTRGWAGARASFQARRRSASRASVAQATT